MIASHEERYSTSIRLRSEFPTIDLPTLEYESDFAHIDDQSRFLKAEYQINA